MKKILYILTFLLTCGMQAQDITGKWNGLLKFPGGQLRLSVNIDKTGSGYTATMDSPDQGATGIPVKTIFYENNILAFSIPEAKIDYRGTLENTTIKGTFTQNSTPFPLEFGRGEVEVAKVNRPQEPVKPYPYHEEEVTFKNEKAGITLAGTLTLPKKQGSFPAVILISGSGPQNRDEEVMDHKPFLVLADHLTRQGIAVLRYDDRGIGASQGDFAGATSADFASDAEAAFNYLKTRSEINKKKIGFAGHSEGGTIAPMVAAGHDDVAFVVLMAGTALPGDEVLMLQNYLIGKAAGMPEEELTKLANINRKVYDIIKQENNQDALREKLREVINREMKPLFISNGIPQDQVNQYIDSQITEMTTPWFTYIIRYNPGPALEKVKCPILAINGEKDLQVAPAANLDAVKRAAQKSGNKKVTVKQMPGLNHLFQECTTGAVEEYAVIEQTMSPAALNEISGWIIKHVK